MSSGNVVLGNFIGTESPRNRGDTEPRHPNGVFIQNAPNNTIGGTRAGAGNVISGNAQHG